MEPKCKTCLTQTQSQDASSFLFLFLSFSSFFFTPFFLHRLLISFFFFFFLSWPISSLNFFFYLFKIRIQIKYPNNRISNPLLYKNTHFFFKLLNFKSIYLKSKFKSKICHPNTTLEHSNSTIEFLHTWDN